MRTRRVICPLLSQKVLLLARKGSSGAGWMLPSTSGAAVPPVERPKPPGEAMWLLRRWRRAVEPRCHPLRPCCSRAVPGISRQISGRV
jgi:hypothetical protein